MAPKLLAMGSESGELRVGRDVELLEDRRVSQVVGACPLFFYGELTIFMACW